MLPRTATVGRAVIGLADLFVAWRNAGPGRSRGIAAHSDIRISLTQRAHGHAGARFSTAFNEIQRED